jgi:hypothetical protein
MQWYWPARFRCRHEGAKLGGREVPRSRVECEVLHWAPAPECRPNRLSDLTIPLPYVDANGPGVIRFVNAVTITGDICLPHLQYTAHLALNVECLLRPKQVQVFGIEPLDRGTIKFWQEIHLEGGNTHASHGERSAGGQSGTAFDDMATHHRDEYLASGPAFKESGCGELGMIGHGISTADFKLDPYAGR